MLVLRHLERISRRFPAPVLTLGNFDGVHCGHREILARLNTRAREVSGTSLVLTFHPHPSTVLAPSKAPILLTDWRGRIDRIARTGVDAVIVQRFTPAFAAIDARDFIRRFLVERLGVRSVVVGHRVSFGHKREGTAETLRQLGSECGFEVEIIGPIQVDSVLVSSSAVRRAVSAGDLILARKLLGYPHSVAGRVVHGHHRGRTLGFPTANLRIKNLVLPPDGVYAVRASFDGVPQHDGIANIGLNPTFEEHERSVEVNVFDFDGNLYGKRAEVCFVRRLRSEIKFPNPQALVEQIRHDADAARSVLAQEP